MGEKSNKKYIFIVTLKEESWHYQDSVKLPKGQKLMKQRSECVKIHTYGQLILFFLNKGAKVIQWEKNS